MNSTNIPYLASMGEIEKSNNLRNNSVIQKNCIFCKKYFYGKEAEEIPYSKNLKKDSLYGFGIFPYTTNIGSTPISLIEEMDKYGKELFKICRKNITVFNIPTNIISPNNLIDAINNSDRVKVINVIKKWCKKHGFPITPIEHELIDGQLYYYELTFEQINIIVIQFILIHLLYKYYNDLSLLMTLNSDSYYTLEQNQISRLKSINDLSKIFGFTLLRIDDGFLEVFIDKPIKEKNRFKNICLKNIIPILNNYSCYFNHPTEKYFSYNRGRISYQSVYTNILDICWDYIASIYNKDFNNNKRKCAICGNEFPIKTDQKYCNQCAKTVKSCKNTQESKKILIQEIIDFYKNNQAAIQDDDLQLYHKLIHYKNLIHKIRNSKNLEQTPKKEIYKFYNKLKENVDWNIV